MPRFQVCMTRDAGEDAAVIVEAADEDAARAAALAMTGEIEWTVNESAGRAEVYEVQQVDDEEPLGSETTEEKFHIAIPVSLTISEIQTILRWVDERAGPSLKTRLIAALPADYRPIER